MPTCRLPLNDVKSEWLSLLAVNLFTLATHSLITWPMPVHPGIMVTATVLSCTITIIVLLRLSRRALQVYGDYWVITPLYVVVTHRDNVAYWPLSAVESIKATSTSGSSVMVSMMVAGQWQRYAVYRSGSPSQVIAAYEGACGRLSALSARSSAGDLARLSPFTGLKTVGDKRRRTWGWWAVGVCLASAVMTAYVAVFVAGAHRWGGSLVVEQWIHAITR